MNKFLIGKAFQEMKTILSTKEMEAIILAEFGITRRTAHNYRMIYQRIKIENEDSIKISRSAAYKIASKNTPEKIKKEYTKKLEAKEPVTHREVKKAIADYQKQARQESVAIRERYRVGKMLISLIKKLLDLLEKYLTLFSPILDKGTINIIQACTNTIIKNVLEPVLRIVNEDRELYLDNPYLVISLNGRA